MKLSAEEIKHIAELSRLDLSDEEVEKYRVELGKILEYVKILNEVETKKVDITAQVSGLMDVFRKDEAKSWPQDELELALNQGEREDGSLKVKRVL